MVVRRAHVLDYNVDKEKEKRNNHVVVRRAHVLDYHVGKEKEKKKKKKTTMW